MTNERKAKTSRHADDGDEERCHCSECLLKFHREMARWFRELVSLQRAKGGLQGRKLCKKVRAGLGSKEVRTLMSQAGLPHGMEPEEL